MGFTRFPHPFKVASKQLKSNGPAGALDQYFPQMEVLLGHLKACVQDDCYLELDNPYDPVSPLSMIVVFMVLNLRKRCSPTRSHTV